MQKKDYKGFTTRPATWESIVEKFNHLSSPFVDELTRNQIIAVVKDLENYTIQDLMEILEKISIPITDKKIQLNHA